MISSSSSSLMQFRLFLRTHTAFPVGLPLCCCCCCFIPPFVFGCGCFIASFSMFLGCCFILPFVAGCGCFVVSFSVRVRLRPAYMLLLWYQFSARLFFQVRGSALRVWQHFHISLLHSSDFWCSPLLESHIARPLLIVSRHSLQRLCCVSITSCSPECSPIHSSMYSAAG